jgi:hypothetical protein
MMWNNFNNGCEGSPTQAHKKSSYKQAGGWRMDRQKIAESCVEKHPENYEFTIDHLTHDE